MDPPQVFPEKLHVPQDPVVTGSGHHPYLCGHVSDEVMRIAQFSERVPTEGTFLSKSLESPLFRDMIM